MTVADIPPPRTRPAAAHLAGRADPDRVVGDLLRQRAELAPTDPRRHLLWCRAVAAGVPTALAMARRYGSRGEPIQDLQQVATLGLIKAVNSYDPERGRQFWAYATPTIAGELKQYFRDSGWAVQVPRRHKELRNRMNHNRDRLTQTLRRLPSPADFAEHLGTGVDEVIQAVLAGNGYQATPLTATEERDRPGRAVDALGVQERGYELVEVREWIRFALTRLPIRERSVIVMRYFGEMSQSQIAAEVGLSQVSVSRLIARTLPRLRQYLWD